MRSTRSITASGATPGASPSTTSLKPPSISKAAASACSSIQKMPKRLSSGTISPGRIV
jgi:hypothetical protein